MSSVSQIWNRAPQSPSARALAATGIGERIWNCVRFLWLGVTFLLFLVMGPFAAIAVFPAVFSLAGMQEGPEPECETPAQGSGY